MDKKVLLKVLKYISVKPRSQKEVENYLLGKLGLSHNEIQEIVDYLKNENYIDDSFLKESYIESRVSRGFGKRYIKFKLALRGIKVEDEEIKTDIDRVVEIVKKRYSRDLEENKYKAKTKIFNFLSYRGFSKNEILEVMRRIFD